jgi:protein TonB
MCAAVNDRPHDAISRPRLPVTGAAHPLRREFERLLATGNAIALSFALLACTVVYLWPREAEVTFAVVFSGEPRVSPSPPPVAPGGGGGEMPAIVTEAPEATIEPVDDDDLVTTPSTIDAGSAPGEEGPGPIPDLPASDGPLVTIAPNAPSPDDFVPFDSAPVLLSWDPPVYPAMVREAGIDGTVNVRVWIGTNGKVKDARVVDGPAALREAALASARTAVFKPALQGVHTVEVWVVMPITFQLHAGP